MDGPRPRRPRWATALPLLVLVLASAVVVAVVVSNGGEDPGSGPSDRSAVIADQGVGEPEPVEVSSDAPRFATLPELVRAADLVVRGEVVSSVEGRWFGAPPQAGSGSAGDARILSRLVTIRVDEVLAGEAPTVGSVLLEEEGWTAAGEPLVVDGLGTAAVGDRGVWFLVAGGDPELGAHVLVNAQGRYLEGDRGSGGGSEGASGDDLLVAELSALSLDELATAVSDVAGSDGGPSGPSGSGG